MLAQIVGSRTSGLDDSMCGTETGIDAELGIGLKQGTEEPRRRGRHDGPRSTSYFGAGD